MRFLALLLLLVAPLLSHSFALPVPSSTPTFLSSATTAATTTTDHIITFRPAAILRLTALLKETTAQPPPHNAVLRMGVRSGGCSGLSYVMDFVNDDTVADDDQIDNHDEVKVGDTCLKCVVDVKSALYLYGMELDFSDELIGGGFQVSLKEKERRCDNVDTVITATLR